MFDFDAVVGASSQATGDVQKFLEKYANFSDKVAAFLSNLRTVTQYNYESPEVRCSDTQSTVCLSVCLIYTTTTTLRNYYMH